jgi:hypothetical protein
MFPLLLRSLSVAHRECAGVSRVEQMKGDTKFRKCDDIVPFIVVFFLEKGYERYRLSRFVAYHNFAVGTDDDSMFMFLNGAWRSIK